MSQSIDEMDRLPSFEEVHEDIPKSVKCHLNIIKWIGVLLILSTSAVPGFVILGMSGCPKPPLDYEVKPDLNQTACVYVKQYPVRFNTYATVCNRDGHVFVDLRRFVNGSATLLGIQLELTQWNSLKQMMSLIDEGLSEARSYRKTLNNL